MNSSKKERCWIILLCLLAFTAACVPTRPATMTEIESPVAVESITEKEIPTVVYEFSNRLHSSYLDTLSGFFTLQFRDFKSNRERLTHEGRIVVLEPDSSHIFWDYSLPYNRYS